MTDQGAFVEIDDKKLSRDGLVLLGMKMALEAAKDDVVSGAMQQTNKVIGQALMQVADRFNDRLNLVHVQLTKSALASKAGKVHSNWKFWERN